MTHATRYALAVLTLSADSVDALDEISTMIADELDLDMEIEGADVLDLDLDTVDASMIDSVVLFDTTAFADLDFDLDEHVDNVDSARF